MIIKTADKEQIKEVVKLSEMFSNENCCNGIIPDSEDYYLNKIVVIAVIDNEIVGYAYGDFETSKKNKSYVSKGEKIFYLGEMYVVPAKRNLNIGRQLFLFLEDYAKTKSASVIELNAVSKNYLKLLDFYINKLNMTFLSAYLYKKI